MTNELDIALLEDFIKDTKRWANLFQNPECPCVFCGMTPNNMVELAKNVEILLSYSRLKDGAKKV